MPARTTPCIISAFKITINVTTPSTLSGRSRCNSVRSKVENKNTTRRSKLICQHTVLPAEIRTERPTDGQSDRAKPQNEVSLRLKTVVKIATELE